MSRERTAQILLLVTLPIWIVPLLIYIASSSGLPWDAPDE